MKETPQSLQSKSNYKCWIAIVVIVYVGVLVLIYCCNKNETISSILKLLYPYYDTDFCLISINYLKLIEHLSLLASAIIALIFNVHRAGHNDKIADNQFEQIKIQIKQTENQTEQIQELKKQVSNQYQQTENDLKSKRDDQFKQAVEFLSKDNALFASKIGAVFILGALGSESRSHAQQCLDMLAELNQWMGERLSHPHFFEPKLNTGTDKDKDFIPWREKILEYSNTTLQNQYDIPHKTKSSKEEFSSLLQTTKDQLKASLQNEDLSRKALTQIEIIITKWCHEIPNSPSSDLLKLNLSNKFLCQLNLSNLSLHDRIQAVGAQMQGALLVNTNLSGAILIKANLSKANLLGVKLIKANLSVANLLGADLTFAKLSRADLLEANLSRTKLLVANLREANLREANLSGANLSGTNLSGADLSRANLSGANLNSANLSGADLSSANLSGADLSFANLSGAYLSWANLSGADLREANLSGAYLKSAVFYSAIFENTILKGIFINMDDINAYSNKSFEERMQNPQEEHLQPHQIRPLMQEDVHALLEDFKTHNDDPDLIARFKHRLSSPIDQPVGASKLIYGTLSSQEAQDLISEYNKSINKE